MNIRSKKIFRCGAAVLLTMLLGACSVSRALESPPEKNFGVLEPGTHRDLVKAEFGEPRRSADGPSCEYYKVTAGTNGWRYLRALGYSILDVGTLGIGEAVTDPLETSFNGDTVQLRVCYGDDQRVLYSERVVPGREAVIITGSPNRADRQP
jgi:hypothetical protein